MLAKYLEYIAETEQSLPPGARNFVFLPYHYAMTDPKCPHDSWVETVNILEMGSRTDRGRRRISILSRFLGAYHDGYFDIEYKNVDSYRMSLKTSYRKITPIGHGDWIVDEILLDRAGHVSHEIIFENGSWKIICEDLNYSWHPIS